MKSKLLNKANAPIIVFLSVLVIFATILTTVTRPSRISASNMANADGRLYLPLIHNNRDKTLGIPLFGVQTYGDTSQSNKYYDNLIDSGATWVRTNIMWRDVEPVNTSPENYNWSTVDTSLAISANPDIHVVATLDNNPDWASAAPGGVLNSAGLEGFVEFASSIVERYDGDGIDDAPGSPVVTYWELYNEPDAGENTWHPGWGDHPNLYTNMLQAVYPAIKSANPHAQVALGGIAYDYFYDQGGTFNHDFLTGVLQAGGGSYFDVMNFHAYPAFSRAWTSGEGIGLLEKTASIRDTLASYGHANKPMIITEAGWHSNDTSSSGLPASYAIQSYYVIEMLTQSLASDIDVMIWWMLFDPGSGYWDNGLVTNDTPPEIKPAYVAYQTAVEELGYAHFRRAWTSAETGPIDMEVYEFEDKVNRRDIYVAWVNPVETTQGYVITLSGSKATIVKVNGTNVSRNTITSTTGTLAITVTAQPVFIEIEK